MLGTLHISRAWALIHSMSTLAIINTFAIPVMREIENIKGRMLTSKEWMVKYFLINFAGLWVLEGAGHGLGVGVLGCRL